MIRIMCLISILVALAIYSLLANSLASKTVFQPARALENNICYLNLQKYIVEIVCIFQNNIVLASVITIRVEEEKEALKHKQSRDFR